MYLGKKQQFDWTFALMVADMVALVLSFPATVFLLFLWNMAGRPVYNAPPFLTSVAYGVLLVYILQHSGLYSWFAFTRVIPTAFRIAVAIGAGAAGFIGLGFLFGETFSGGSAHWVMFHCIVCVIALMISRVLTRWVLMDVCKVIPIERIAFIGWSARLERVLAALAKEMGSFHEMVGFFHQSADPSGEPALKRKFKPLGRLDELEAELDKGTISLLIVEEGSVSRSRLHEIAEASARSIVSLKVIPTAFDIWATKLSLRVVAGIPLLGVYNLRYDRFHNRILKRALDICCASFGLIVSAPIIAIMAILIKRESPGPIFFKQTRLGLYGRPFEIIKLRSMRTDAEVQTGAVWAVKDDPRRLKIGTFMRSRNIDELPQFWNVLKGDMSMVGPRPERPEFVTDFKNSVRYYNLRHSCKPGVTGWAAVHGLRGDTSLDDRLEYDLFYIENWSLWLDIKIMFMTLRPPKNAY